MSTRNPADSKPTWGAPPPDPNPIGRNAYRDGFHNGRWSALKRPGFGHGQSDPYVGHFTMPPEARDPFRYDRTLPTPMPTKG
jgi:hypothetical protein